MAWRTLVIANPAKLRVENDQLIITQEDSVALPLEDIGVLVLESQDVALSSALLSRLADHDILLLVCDRSHLPCLAALPFAGHSRLTGIQRMQLGISLPFKKRCWQIVTKQKIANQAECLKVLHREGVERLRSLVPSVQSGDTGNVESFAAREYFRYLFGTEFIRGVEDTWNSALNYGYAIFRASVARALASHGFLLTQGIHHCSELNPFNLVDDFLEPFRPVVDLYAAGTVSKQEDFEKEHRRALALLLSTEVLIDDKRQSMQRAAEIMAASFVSACRAKEPDLLKMPGLLPLKQHTYE